MDYNINFPHLGIFLDHVGKNISIGNFTIAYYGIVIAIGMLIGLRVAMWRAKETGQKPDDYVDIVLIGMLVGIIGARIYYVVFSWDAYKNDLMSIFNIREGGLAIYGGIIAGSLTILVMSKIKKIPVGLIFDTIAMSVPIGQIVGRWGNFFNREALNTRTISLRCSFRSRLCVSTRSPRKCGHTFRRSTGSTTYRCIRPSSMRAAGT